jgi:hypothetical protein
MWAFAYRDMVKVKRPGTKGSVEAK